MITMKYQKVKT